MSLLSLASAQSVWRGYEYFKEKNIITFNEVSNTKFKGSLKGSGGNYYETYIDIEHPRKSRCNCLHANGKRIICKHMIALYFHTFPKEAEKYYNEVIVYELEEEKRQEEMEQKVINYIRRLKKDELQELILKILFDGPEWQYEEFINKHIE
ncbi:MAG: SWIM zinc finger domain-containing protein [Eubacteriales bacterium]